MPRFHFKKFFPYLIIFLVGLLAYGFFFSPAIYYDDWQDLIARYYHNLTPWINLAFSRPLRETLWKLMITLFGFNPGLMLACNILLRIASAMVLFRLHREVEPDRPIIGLAFALLTLVYPADKTRMWLVLVNFGWLMGCVGALLFYKYSRGGGIWLLIGSAICFLLPPLEYEGILGIITAWGVLLLLYTFPLFYPPQHRIKWSRWIGMVTPLVLFGLYVFYRLVWVNIIGIGGFHQVKATDPFNFIRYLWAGFIAMGYGWIEPLNIIFPGLRLREIIIVVLLVLIIWFLLSWLISRLISRKNGWMNDLTINHRQVLRRGVFTCLAGLILCTAGFFPFITYAPPGIDFFSSRFNTYALVGASLLLVGGLDLIIRLVIKENRQAVLVFSLMIIPFVVGGTACEMAVQRQTQILWQEYSHMWQGIFKVAPGLEDNISVVLVVNHTLCKPLEYGERPFLYSNMANWELTDAFNILYGTQRISADFVYKECKLPYHVRFRGEGYNNPPSYDGVHLYPRVLVLVYDRQTRQVKVAENLQEVAGFTTPGYKPYHLITAGPGPNAMRYLVEP